MWKRLLGLALVLVALGLGGGSLGEEGENSEVEKLNAMAVEAYHAGKYVEAEELFEKALEILEASVGPEHKDYLATKGSLAVVLSAQGRGEESRLLTEEILQARTRNLGPEHPDTLRTKSNLASRLYSQGDLEAARALFEDVLKIETRLLGPEHPETLITKNNLATTLQAQGDLEASRALFEDVLKSRTRLLGPEHPETLITKNNLASTLQDQGDLQAARDLEEDVLKSRTRLLGPEHPETLITKNNLASTLRAQGDLEACRALQEDVLKIQARLLGPEHPSTLITKSNLATTLKDQGDLLGARAIEEEVLAAKNLVLGFEHPETLITKQNLAWTLMKLGELEDARQLLEETIAADQKTFGDAFLPDHHLQALRYWELGMVHKKLGNLPKAADNFLEAIAISERQTARANASEDERSTFRTQYDPKYQGTIRTLVDLDRDTEAFDILQRYQAQSFQRQLFQRIGTNAQVPAELATQRQRLTWQYDQLSHRFHGSDSAKERQSLRPRLDQLQRDLQVNRDAILEATGQKNATVALGLETIRATLAPGTLLLSYLTSAEEGNLLFALDHQGKLTVYQLPTTLDQLEAQIDRFLGQSTENPGSQGASTAEQQRARLLYDKLLAPAAERIAQSERLLVIPDGPLHHLPFAALAAPASDPSTERDWQYLVEWKPIHTAASASLYAHLRQAPRRAPMAEHPLRIAAVGDPVFPEPGSANPEAQRWIQAAEERSLFDGLSRLPHSAREVEAIGELYGGEGVEILRRAEATEGRVKSLLPRAEILHFATHGIVDPERPLDSFVALTIPETLEEGQDNGILQAWELDEWQLAAELVVLSACETATGENRGGEGVISLSRAFQAAGARSVVASLWRVADASTAELMVRFHRHLRDGLPKSEALRQAQLELIRDPEIRVPTLDTQGHETVIESHNFSHPYHWAAFQLIGDWQ